MVVGVVGGRCMLDCCTGLRGAESREGWKDGGLVGWLVLLGGGEVSWRLIVASGLG